MSRGHIKKFTHPGFHLFVNHMNTVAGSKYRFEPYLFNFANVTQCADSFIIAEHTIQKQLNALRICGYIDLFQMAFSITNRIFVCKNAVVSASDPLNLRFC